MRIQSIASFYDAASRVNGINRISQVEALQASENTDISSNEKKEILPSDYSGVKQTLVSPENAYQKQMLTDPDFAMKRMAGKLMDKLPQIMDDMSKLPDELPVMEDVLAKDSSPSKVVIGENSNVDYSGNAAAALQDISL